MHLTAIMKQAERTLHQEGKHRPTLLVTFEGLTHPTRLTLPSFPATPQQRQHTLFLKGKQCAEQYSAWQVQRVWFIGEAWINGLEDTAPRFVAPSADPKRREVLVVIELDASTDELKQAIEVREIHRTRRGKLKGVTPVPELEPASDQVTPLGVLLLAFLAGFVETAPSREEVSRSLYAKIVHQRMRMDQLIDNERPFSWE